MVILTRWARRWAIGAMALLVNVLAVGRAGTAEADRWFEGDPQTRRALADVVARQAASRDRNPYHSGNSRFDGQSAVATDAMALLGLSQVVEADRTALRGYLPAMRAAGDRLADPRQLQYAAQRYGQSGLVRLDPGEGHAYLGYVALALGALRRWDPDTPHAALHDRLVDDLAARLFASPTGLVETYPGETWPPDVAAVAAAVGQSQRFGPDRSAAMRRWAGRYARCAIDPHTGWLRQRVTACGKGTPRGSGTAIAAYFSTYAAPDLGAELAAALAAEGARSWLGLGAVREYPLGQVGRGDIDSGPVIAGVSVGATGFGLGAARAYGERDLFVSSYRTTRLVGLASARGRERSFAIGGDLGNALLLAMLTAPVTP